MATEFYIGTSGWSYRHWRGLFYPEGLSMKEWLSFFSGHYNTVEVNMTFYRTPTEAAVRNWFDRTGDGFIFTFKASRSITHLKRLSGTEGLLSDFYSLMAGCGSRARCVLFQLPPSFRKTMENMARVDDFLSLLDPRFDHAMEFRHASWWCDECYGLLENRCAFCSVDGLDMPRGLVVTADVAYLRLHGRRYDICYGRGELQPYVDRLAALAGRGRLKRVYVYFNNDVQGFAVRNAAQFRGMLA
ncbi:MAG: DUF72 domain-containing protein [Spirochaetes bacterium]|nr:DUF72 domain-containing protein [Spirochaetota bacterium]